MGKSSSGPSEASVNARRRIAWWKRKRSYILLTLIVFVVFFVPSGPKLSKSSLDVSGLPADLAQDDIVNWDQETLQHLQKRKLGSRGRAPPAPPFFEESLADLDEDSERSPPPPPKPLAQAAPPKPKKKPIIEVTESQHCKIPRRANPCRLPHDERIHVVFVSAMWFREPFTQDETENMLKSIMYQTNCRLFIHFLVAGEPEQSLLPSMMEAMGGVNVPAAPSPYLSADGDPAAHHHRLLLQQDPAASAGAGAGAGSDAGAGAGGGVGEGEGEGGQQQSLDVNATLLYSLHPIPTEWVLERAKGLHLFPLAHHAGVPGMCKFFMPEILWQVRRAVYMDVDMIFAGDIQDLWGFFREVDDAPEMLYFMGNNHPEGHNRRRLLRPYCSCQLVMDLERMRAANLTQMILKALNGRKPKSLDDYVEDGDQWLFMWLCKQYKGACRVLPRMWNVSGCTKPVPFLGLGARGQEVNGTCWRVVHFNCMGHIRGRQGSYKVPPLWSEAYRWVKHLRVDQVKNHFLHRLLPKEATPKKEKDVSGSGSSEAI